MAPVSPISLLTASIASAAFLMTLPKACAIRRLSNVPFSGSLPKSRSNLMSERLTSTRNDASRNASRMSITFISGLGMRAKAENSSTMRPMSSTWRMIVSVHWSKTSRSSVMTLP